MLGATGTSHRVPRVLVAAIASELVSDASTRYNNPVVALNDEANHLR